MSLNITTTYTDQVVETPTTGPYMNVSQVTAITDQITGQTSTRYFEKRFSWSKCLFIWSDWLGLSKIDEINISPFEPLYFKFQYIRKGSQSGNLTLVDITPTLTTVSNPFVKNVFDQTFFKKWLTSSGDQKLLPLTLNLTEKLYDKGIVAQSLTRNENQDYEQDRDYIEFWKSVSNFFAMFHYMSDVIENFTEHNDLLQQYLIQRGVFIAGNETNAQLLKLVNEFYDQIRKRSTIEASLPNDKTINGEILRLINWQLTDEFFYDTCQLKHSSWNVNNSSPCYRGVWMQNHLSHLYEKTTQTYDLTKYDKAGTVTIVDNSLKISAMSQVGGSRLIVIDPNLSYCLSFDIKIPAATDNFKIGIIGFDVDGNEVLLQNVHNSSETQWFVEYEMLPFQNNRWYTVTCYCFNHQQATLTQQQSVLDIGVGSHKKLKNTIKYISPVLYNGSFIDIYVNNLKFGILSTNYSKAFIQGSDLIEAIVVNNNQSQSITDITANLRNFFVPYNMSLIVSQPEQQQILDSDLYWNDGFGRIWTDVLNDEWIW